MYHFILSTQTFSQPSHQPLHTLIALINSWKVNPGQIILEISEAVSSREGDIVTICQIGGIDLQIQFEDSHHQNVGIEWKLLLRKGRFQF